MKRTTLILLALLMLIPVCSVCFTSCVETNDVSKDTTVEAATAEPVTTEEFWTDSLPEVKFTGYTFRMLGQGGSGWTASDIEIPEDGSTGDVLNDAKHLRYEKVKERFGLEDITATLSDNVYVTVQSAIRSGDKDFDLIDMGTGNTSTAALASLLIDLKSLNYLDLTQPYYDQNYIHDMSVGNKLFSVVTDITTMDTFCMWIMMYNKVMLAKHDLPDPYDLVKENKWTLDMFNSMLANVSKENGDSKWDNADTYGLGAHSGSARNFYYACGLTVCAKDESTDLPIITVSGSDKLVAACDEITDILYADNKTLFNGAIVEAFEQGRELFLAEITGYLGRFRDMENDFGVCPYPKYDSTQERYYTTNDPCIMVFSIPAFGYTDAELERTSIIFEALCSASYSTVRPAYYDDVLGGKETRDYQSYEMLNLCKESRVYDFGLFNNVGTLSSLFSGLCGTKTPNVVSTVTKGLKAANKKLTTLVEKYEAIGTE